MSTANRLAQGAAALWPTRPGDLDSILADALLPAQRTAFRTLSAYDQLHLVAVYRALRAAGITESDLLRAGLLHDIGKAARGGRVRQHDRILLVLLEATSPRLLDEATRQPALRWRRGLALARHHPRLGAEWAAKLGCSAWTYWLIAHHADDPPPDDPDLRRLFAADRSV